MAKDNIGTMFYESFIDAVKYAYKEADVDKYNKILENVENIDLSDVFVSLIDEYSEKTTRNMKSTMYEKVMAHRATDDEFIARQEEKWYKGFVASEAMYHMTLESAEMYSKYVSELSKDELEAKINTYTALKHLHGRALQQFLEIIVLMKNGFADGAYARWRSMYELSIIATFITEHGENVAKSFINASNTEDRYDWAKVSGVFSNKKNHITFNDIQKNCNINISPWLNQYDLANKIVHASSQGTFARLSNMLDINPCIPVGRSDYGLTTPAEHSAISLSIISTLFFTIYPCGDALHAAKCISNWVDVIRDIYFKIHDEVFPNDEPLWDKSLACFDINE